MGQWGPIVFGPEAGQTVRDLNFHAELRDVIIHAEMSSSSSFQVLFFVVSSVKLL